MPVACNIPEMDKLFSYSSKKGVSTDGVKDLKLYI